MKLYAKQAVNALKSEIVTILTNKIVDADVKEFVNNKDYFCSFVVSLAAKWTLEEPIIISTSDAIALKNILKFMLKIYWIKA